MFIVLEYLPYGDLLGYLRKSRGIEDNYNTGEKEPSSALSEKDLLSFAWMIADGMDYFASMKVRNLVSKAITYLFSRFSNLIWMETGNGYLVTSFCIPNVVFNRLPPFLLFINIHLPFSSN